MIFVGIRQRFVAEVPGYRTVHVTRITNSLDAGTTGSRAWKEG